MTAPDRPAAIHDHLAHLGPARLLRAGGDGLPAVHAIAPTEDDPVWTLYTVGLSDAPMAVPAGVAAPARAELTCRLPGGWPLDEASLPAALEDDETGWPVRWLTTLARVPAALGTWLGALHTIPNGEPQRQLGPGTALAGFLLVPPAGLDDGADVVATPDGPVALLALVPLHADELRLAVARGAQLVLERLVEVEVDDVFDLDRPSVAPPVARRDARRRR